MRTSSAALISESPPQRRRGHMPVKRSLSQGEEQFKDEDKGSVLSGPLRSTVAFSSGGRDLLKQQSDPLS